MQNPWIIRIRPKADPSAPWREVAYSGFPVFLKALQLAKTKMESVMIEVVEAEDAQPMERQAVKDLGFDNVFKC